MISVFVDLDENVDEETKNSYLNISDVTVLNLSQRLRNINKFAETKVATKGIQDKKRLVLIGRYDKYSKYNSKNIQQI